LATPQVGDYLNRHFVSGFQKVATFQLNGGEKQGGNVACYFCTPDGLVLHAIAGPVDGETFLREAQWASDTYNLATLHNRATPAQLRAFFRPAHLERLSNDRGVQVALPRPAIPSAYNKSHLERLLDQNQHLRLDNQGKVNLLLAVAPLPPIDQVYQVVFEKILNENISTRPVVGR
jgi:hypothetical protein